MVGGFVFDVGFGVVSPEGWYEEGALELLAGGCGDVDEVLSLGSTAERRAEMSIAMNGS